MLIFSKLISMQARLSLSSLHCCSTIMSLLVHRSCLLGNQMWRVHGTRNTSLRNLHKNHCIWHPQIIPMTVLSPSQRTLSCHTSSSSHTMVLGIPLVGAICLLVPTQQANYSSTYCTRSFLEDHKLLSLATLGLKYYALHMPPLYCGYEWQIKSDGISLEDSVEKSQAIADV